MMHPGPVDERRRLPTVPTAASEIGGTAGADAGAGAGAGAG